MKISATEAAAMKTPNSGKRSTVITHHTHKCPLCGKSWSCPNDTFCPIDRYLALQVCDDCDREG